MRAATATAPWWQTDSLIAQEEGLRLDGEELAALARLHGTPLYVYSRPTVCRQLRRIQEVLHRAVGDSVVYYAMKANRHPEVLRAVRTVQGVGIDACSPREVIYAMEHGFKADEISFNAGMLSNRDLATLAERGVHCTLDSFSALRRYGQLVPSGTRVGLRFDPGVRASYHSQKKMAYGQGKFGFEPKDASNAVSVAQRAGLVVDTVHMHVGWGLAEESRDQVADAFERLATIARRIPTLTTVNVGGGLGGRYVSSDQPLGLETWAEILHTHLAPLHLRVACEPGTLVVASAGVLLVEVNTVERRRGATWVGIDASFAVNLNPAHYGIPLTVVPVSRPLAHPKAKYHLAGNINEATDMWARDLILPGIEEGELLALLPAGAYGSSMGSDHCLRGRPEEVAVGAIDD